eukprot:SAG11_NODE_1825_length_4203_cov_3.238304_3_plen_150_part_00
MRQVPHCERFLSNGLYCVKATPFAACVVRSGSTCTCTCVVDELLLSCSDLAQAVNLLDAMDSDSDLGREERCIGDRRLHEGVGSRLLPIQCPHAVVGEVHTRENHREGGTTPASLGLDNLVPAEHDAVHQAIVRLLIEVPTASRGRLGE